MRAREQKSPSLQEHVVLPSPTYETSRTMSSPPPLGPKSGVKSDFVGGNVAPSSTKLDAQRCEISREASRAYIRLHTHKSAAPQAHENKAAGPKMSEPKYQTTTCMEMCEPGGYIRPI
jgi:hypothetical protein